MRNREGSWGWWCVALCASGVALAGCGDDGDAAGRDAGQDAGAQDAGPPPPAWPRELPAAMELGGARRGYSVRRAIIHLHSPLSHDACDGEGWVAGRLGDPECLASLRSALCAVRVDVAMVTDHAPHVNEVGFEEAFLADAADEAVTDGAGNVIGNRIHCPDGHEALVTVGSENFMMPVGLRRHALEGATAEELGALYDGEDAAAVAAFRDAGALVLMNHTEEKPLEVLRELGLDGIEIYNVHANLDPDIRTMYLGLDDFGFIAELLHFTDRRQSLAGDLAFLSFFEENGNDLGKWDALLSEGVRMPGLAGSDAHENTFPDPLGDGERADSYRRILRWFSNHLLVGTGGADELEDVHEAVAAARFYVAFEAFGSPVGFDFVASDGGAIAEMGEDAAVGATLRVVRPSLPADHPAAPAPAISMRILRSEATGAVEVARGTGEALEHVVTEPGAYRAEVRMVPEHARPYLGRRADALIREVVWVYSNAIHVPAAR